MTVYNPFITYDFGKDIDHIDKTELYRDQIEKAVHTSANGKQTFVDGHFAKAYILVNDLVFSNGAFYTQDGMYDIATIQREVAEMILDVFPTNLAQNTNKSVASIKHLSARDGFDFTNKLMIPFANGDMHVSKTENWVFKTAEKQPVPYRLSVSYPVINTAKIETPHFDKWLSDLFYEEDIITLQEYLGYCLIPTTRAQKALILIGNGGEGKSVLGNVLEAIMGQAMVAPVDTMDFFKDKFKIPELENKLVLYEDDLSERMLESSGLFKKLVTSETSITADRKGEQPFQFRPFCRFIMLSNSMIRSRFDTTDAFYRRLLPLHVKPKEPDREVIPNFGSLISQEAQGILQWMVAGLKRLIDNNWQFTISKRSEDYLGDTVSIANHFPEFMDEILEPSLDGSFATRDLVDAYNNWCLMEGTEPRADRALENWIGNGYELYGLRKDNNVVRDNGRRARGYAGGKIKSKYAGFFSNGKMNLV